MKLFRLAVKSLLARHCRSFRFLASHVMTCLEVFLSRFMAELLTKAPLRPKLMKQTIMKGGRYDTFVNNGAAVLSLTVDVYSPWDLQWHGEWRDSLTAGWRSGLSKTDELWTLIDIPGSSSQWYLHDNNINTQLLLSARAKALIEVSGLRGFL